MFIARADWMMVSSFVLASLEPSGVRPSGASLQRGVAARTISRADRAWLGIPPLICQAKTVAEASWATRVCPGPVALRPRRRARSRCRRQVFRRLEQLRLDPSGSAAIAVLAEDLTRFGGQPSLQPANSSSPESTSPSRCQPAMPVFGSAPSARNRFQTIGELVPALGHKRGLYMSPAMEMIGLHSGSFDVRDA